MLLVIGSINVNGIYFENKTKFSGSKLMLMSIIYLVGQKNCINLKVYNPVYDDVEKRSIHQNV